MVVVKRALLSCYDKTGLEAFARGLIELGVELIASSGTAAFLQQHDLRAKTVEEFAGAAEQLEGRVKTLHPRIHAGILARRDDPDHVKAVGSDGLIDLVVVNLYPFEEFSHRPGVLLDEALEQIDIGGVALLRAAAKNSRFVAVVSEKGQYPKVLEGLKRNLATLSEEESLRLATAAFTLTSRYDQWIADFLAPTGRTLHPEQLTAQARKRQALRYGENPHQQAAWYVPLMEPPSGLTGLVQLQGKELSYNNILDLDAAVRCLVDFERSTCVIVKHTCPCGIASATSITEAYRRAHDCDPESAFGAVVGINRPLDAHTASQMAEAYLELIVAPTIEPQVKAIVARRSNLRVVELKDPAASSSKQWRSVLGGWLVQEWDLAAIDRSALQVVTKRNPTNSELEDLTFAWIAAKHVSSNAIVLAKDEATVGIGQGQPSRVRAVRLAIQNAGNRSRGAVLASDGFFPFPDSITLAAKAGISAVIQPGGSVKDRQVMAAADEAGLAMIFTGLRHFRH